MDKRIIIFAASFFFFPLAYVLFFGILPFALSINNLFGAAVFTLSLLLFVVGILLLMTDIFLLLMEVSKVLAISYSYHPEKKRSHQISIKIDVTKYKDFKPIRKGGHLSRLSHK